MKVISLGLGVQSTALYYMSSMGELPRADYAIFADTGGEKTPRDFARAVKVDLAIRDSKRGGLTTPQYLHRSLLPIDQVNFDESQSEAWGDCHGFCNI